MKRIAALLLDLLWPRYRAEWDAGRLYGFARRCGGAQRAVREAR